MKSSQHDLHALYYPLYYTPYRNCFVPDSSQLSATSQPDSVCCCHTAVRPKRAVRIEESDSLPGRWQVAFRDADTIL